MDFKYKYLKYKKKYIELVNKLNNITPLNKKNRKYNKGKAIRDSYSISGYNKKYIKI